MSRENPKTQYDLVSTHGRLDLSPEYAKFLRSIKFMSVNDMKEVLCDHARYSNELGSNTWIITKPIQTFVSLAVYSLHKESDEESASTSAIANCIIPKGATVKHRRGGQLQSNCMFTESIMMASAVYKEKYKPVKDDHFLLVQMGEARQPDRNVFRVGEMTTSCSSNLPSNLNIGYFF